MPGWRGRLTVLVLVVAATVGAADRVLAQARAARSFDSRRLCIHQRASGTLTFGFARQAAELPAAITAASVLPRGSQIPSAAKELVERCGASPRAFRRQCVRLTEASVEIVISLDFPRHRSNANAETVMTRKGGLRAHIHMRAADIFAAELLAHEIEHILEQLDDVDLALAVAERVDGARLVNQPAAFETSRAIAVGRAVAREVLDSTDRDSSERR